MSFPNENPSPLDLGASPETALAYIGLGSNLDEPALQVWRAFAALDGLPRTRLAARSSLYLSRPLGHRDQPDYVNAVAAVETRLGATDLLTALQAVEAEQGRVRGSVRWAPRTLDLDLLLYGAAQLDEPRLVVPHPGLAHRDFVLYPLYELDPELEIPGRGALRDCLRQCPLRGLRRMEDMGESFAS